MALNAASWKSVWTRGAPENGRIDIGKTMSAGMCHFLDFRGRLFKSFLAG